MKIQMLKTKLGSSNGINVTEYEEGEIYDISEPLAEIFLSDNSAKEIEGSKMTKPPHNKSVTNRSNRTQDEDDF